MRTATVLSTTEDACTVYADDARLVVPYAPPFPRPRTERVSPGHLVALAEGDGTEAVVWRWYDAVVLESHDGTVTLWEPAHGVVEATARDPRHTFQPGTRAYASAGLPGADWWVCGAVPDLDEVARFFGSDTPS